MERKKQKEVGTDVFGNLNEVPPIPKKVNISSKGGNNNPKGKEIPIKTELREIHARGFEIAFVSLVGKKVGMEVYFIDENDKRIATLGHGATKIGDSLTVRNCDIHTELTFIADNKITKKLDAEVERLRIEREKDKE